MIDSAIPYDPNNPEIKRIVDALKKHEGDKLQAAISLGISRITLYRKLHEYGLLDELDRPD